MRFFDVFRDFFKQLFMSLNFGLQNRVGPQKHRYISNVDLIFAILTLIRLFVVLRLK